MSAALLLYLVTVVISTSHAQTSCLEEQCTPCYQHGCTIDNCYIQCPCQHCPEGFALERDDHHKSCNPFPDQGVTTTTAPYLDGSNVTFVASTSTAATPLNTTTVNPKVALKSNSVTAFCYKCQVFLCSECTIDNFVSDCMRCQEGYGLIHRNDSHPICGVKVIAPTNVDGSQFSEALTAGITVAGVSLLAVSAVILFLINRRRHLEHGNSTPDSLELQDSSVNNYIERITSRADSGEESSKSRVSKFSTGYQNLTLIEERENQASILIPIPDGRSSLEDYCEASSQEIPDDCGAYESITSQEDAVYQNDGYVSCEEEDLRACESLENPYEPKLSLLAGHTCDHNVDHEDSRGVEQLSSIKPVETKLHDDELDDQSNCGTGSSGYNDRDSPWPEVKTHLHHCSNSWARRKAPLSISCTSESENECVAATESNSGRRRYSRSYICIAPTSPSEKYVEAAADTISNTAPHQSDTSSTPFRMEWLTKSFTQDLKNELSTYQTSTAVQTESSVTTPIKTTVFGTSWQFGGTFTSQGGVLQAGGSDVVLTVPPGAVPKAQAVDIYGAVFTNNIDIRNKLIFPSEESLITPVVEYISLPTCKFERHIRILLPHALQSDVDVENMKVYTFTVDELGRVDTSCLPFRDKSNTDNFGEAFWEDVQDGGKICITTSHFSGYFCTLCGSSSILPSIYTMMFGSHVQIEQQNRREIRVILYIWDRRLTIKDYFERFRKQESESDRQLLTEMQVPLLNDASCDSRLVMRMEFLGYEEERQCWRHVARPGGTRYLFKPLQVRRLSEIVECCRHTEPIRVEWAVENKPGVEPGPVFQCCIDIMHAPESTSDYEAALNEDLDDLMRSFYVRNLKVTPSQDSLSSSGPKFEAASPRPSFQPTQLKRTLSETLDLQQAERLFLELGFTSKDIGNFHKKFASESAVKVALIEECIRRLGPDKINTKLPAVLDNLRLLNAPKGIEKRPNHNLKTCNQHEPSKNTTGNQDVKEMPVLDLSLTQPKLFVNENLETHCFRNDFMQSFTRADQSQNNLQPDNGNGTFQDQNQTSKKEIFGANIVA